MNLKIKNKSLEYLNNNFSTRLYNVMKINRSDNNNNNNNNNITQVPATPTDRLQYRFYVKRKKTSEL
jgi:hypothetical protein